MADVAILGAGMMGTAIAWPLADNGHQVHLVGTHFDGEIIRACLETRQHPCLRRRLPEGIQPFYLEQLVEALAEVDVVVSGVNSLGVHWAGQMLGAVLRPGMTVLAVTKGLEAGQDGDLRIPPDFLASELPRDL
jgi:glycerol-3-phosphate dehydrogenase (NAD(P)+)